MSAEAAGDEQARRVAELFEQHRGAIYAYVARLSRDSHLAEEITQETFLKVYQARDQLPGIGNLRAWIFRIATNTCLTTMRRNRRFRWLPWDAAESLPGPGRDEAGRVGQRDAIERALNSLSQEYRAPLLLFSYHGFRVAEIAEVLGISEGAVKTRVYRAKEMFLRAYRQDEDR
ncbi:MAG: RNA polymerase sigma factor [Nitrososphaerales archaeon]